MLKRKPLLNAELLTTVIIKADTKADTKTYYITKKCLITSTMALVEPRNGARYLFDFSWLHATFWKEEKIDLVANKEQISLCKEL